MLYLIIYIFPSGSVCNISYKSLHKNSVMQMQLDAESFFLMI